MELKDKTIIITGASSGIGAAAALLFAAEGAKVVLGARRETELAQIAGQITHSNGQAVSLTGDVAGEAYAAALVELAESRFGGLDGAFNNAGMMGEMEPAPSMGSENWRAVLATNLTSAFFAAKAQLPALTKGTGGSLVFTGSFVGVSNGGMPGTGIIVTVLRRRKPAKTKSVLPQVFVQAWQLIISDAHLSGRTDRLWQGSSITGFCP